MPYNGRMKQWHLKAGDPLSLILASDPRTAPTDYLDDQIWELALDGGDPPAFGLKTTFGLRARLVRVFLRFTEGDQVRSNPADFHAQPELNKIYSNFIEASFMPFEGIDVISEYWVPNSHAVAGRVTVCNHSERDRDLFCEVVGQLSSNDGQRFAPFEMSAATLLCGHTSGLSPVIFMTGGAKSGVGPYPSLSLKYHLASGETRQFSWVETALKDRDASYNLAREISAVNWEAVKSRIEMLNASQVEITTGNPDWDAAFMLAQKAAANLVIGPTASLPCPSFVSTRQPDQGYSLKGDGSDYSHLWNGQTAFEANYLLNILLPGHAETAQNILSNFFANQAENGQIDFKPGLGGQKNHMLATPLLAEMVWKVFEVTGSLEFLEQSFSPLRSFLECWFSQEHDRDQDGYPEWDNPLQTGLEYHPHYSRWQSASLGIQISVAESPALGAMLCNECDRLAQIAEKLQRIGEVEELLAKRDHLKDQIESTWAEAAGSYLDRDRDVHVSPPGEILLNSKGAGYFMLRKSFAQPVRLVIQIRTDEAIRRHPVIFIHGRSASGQARIEKIDDGQFRWMPGLGQLTGRINYSFLERIEIYGLEPEDQTIVQNINFFNLDLTMLSPLWAGIPDEERAEKMLAEAITYPAVFWREYGLPVCPQPDPEYNTESCWSLNLPWNALVGSGMVRYDFRKPAAELVIRLMSAIINTLKKDRAFRGSYHAETGIGSGEYHSLNGIAPLGLFLEVLGIQLISPKRVFLRGFNPFPWPVTVKYRGLTINRLKEKTEVVFPGGQAFVIADPEPRLVSLEPNVETQ